MRLFQQVLNLTQFRDIDSGNVTSRLSPILDVNLINPKEGVLPYDHEKLGLLSELCDSTRQVLSTYLDAKKATRRNLARQVRKSINGLLSLAGEINTIRETLYDPAQFPKKYWPYLNMSKFAQIGGSSQQFPTLVLYNQKRRFINTFVFEEGAFSSFWEKTNEIKDAEQLFAFFKSSCNLNEGGEIEMR